MKAWYFMFFQTADGRGDWFAEIWWGDINRLNSLSFFFLLFFLQRDLCPTEWITCLLFGGMLFIFEKYHSSKQEEPCNSRWASDTIDTLRKCWTGSRLEVTLHWIQSKFKAAFFSHIKCNSGMFPSTGLEGKIPGMCDFIRKRCACQAPTHLPQTPTVLEHGYLF